LVLVERRLDRMSEALAQLGMRPCSSCGRFFRQADAGALCDCVDLICYSCIPEWWPRRRPELSVHDREQAEIKLLRWLVSHHRGEVIRDPRKLPIPEDRALELVAACAECGATGRVYNSNCSHCSGRGTVWVVVRKSADFDG
jgi:hypothetical protein